MVIDEDDDSLFPIKNTIKPCKSDLSDIDYLMIAIPVSSGH